MLVLRLGWRNLWRNTRRSLLSIAAVAVAFGVLVTLESLREGMALQLLDNGTRLVLGHLQVHDAEYVRGRSLYDTIGGDAGTEVAQLLRTLESVPGVFAAAPRVIGFGLLSTGMRSAGAQLLGVDPGREVRVTRLLGTVVSGQELAGARGNSVLLGRTLADELGAGVGDEVAVVTQAADGSLGNELLRVRGIVHTGLPSLDRSLAIMRLDDLQSLMALAPSRVHEIAVRVDDPGRASRIASDLAASPRLPERARVRSWEELAPALVDYLRLLHGWSWVVVFIFAVFASLGVTNAMLMAVFERTHEIGMLASVGLRPGQVLGMILAESSCLAGVGLAAGLSLGVLGMAYFSWHGWDLSQWTRGLTVAGVLVDPTLRGAFVWREIPRIAVVVAAVAVLATLLPALRAARMRPVQALAAPGE